VGVGEFVGRGDGLGLGVRVGGGDVGVLVGGSVEVGNCGVCVAEGGIVGGKACGCVESDWEVAEQPISIKLART